MVWIPSGPCINYLRTILEIIVKHPNENYFYTISRERRVIIDIYTQLEYTRVKVCVLIICNLPFVCENEIIPPPPPPSFFITEEAVL